MYGLSNTDLTMISTVFKKYPMIHEVIIFGSRALGTYKPGSDVDLAVKGDVSGDVITNISIELNERLPLPYKFDVLAYHLIDNPSLKQHIDHTGQHLILS